MFSVVPLITLPMHAVPARIDFRGTAHGTCVHNLPLSHTEADTAGFRPWCRSQHAAAVQPE